jgi:DNA mismatch repair protein MutH
VSWGREKKIAEFEKADIALKTIRLEHSGTLKEGMSFPQIQYQEIVEEAEWEDSFWYETLTRRFFLVIFQKNENKQLRLKKVMFWTMPTADLEIAKEFWEDTKQKILDDDYEHFIRISDDKICHVRPKGVDSSDLMWTPSGRKQRKKCYWLNSSYIKRIIS